MNRLFPLLLFFSLFLLDKVFLLPFVQEKFVKNRLSVYEGLFTFQDKVYKEHLNHWRDVFGSDQVTVKKQTVFFGSSRSAEFADLKDSDFLNNPYWNQSLPIPPVTSMTVRAGNFTHVYLLYRNFIKNYGTDSILVLELNSVSFSLGSVFRDKKEIQEIPPNMFRDLYPSLSNKERNEYLSSQFFVLNRLNLNFTGKENQDVTKVMDSLLILKKALERKPELKNGFQFAGFEEGTENKEQNASLEKLNEWVLNSFCRNFKLNTTELRFLEDAVKLAKEKKIRLILYRPKIHKMLRETSAPLLKAENEWLQYVTEISKKYEVPFIDLEKNDYLKCRYFVDTSHMSKSCFPEVLQVLKEKSGYSSEDIR